MAPRRSRRSRPGCGRRVGPDTAASAGQCVAGGGHQPPGQVAAHRQARPAANRVTPSAASQAGSANSAATSRPVFVPSTLPSTSVSPGETPVKLAQQVVLDRRAGAGPAGLVRGPGGQLHDHRVLPADRAPCPASSGPVIASRSTASALTPRQPRTALLGHVRRVELPHLPARRPRRPGQQWPGVMAGRRHAHSHQGTVRQNPACRAASTGEQGRLRLMPEQDREEIL